MEGKHWAHCNADARPWRQQYNDRNQTRPKLHAWKAPKLKSNSDNFAFFPFPNWVNAEEENVLMQYWWDEKLKFNIVVDRHVLQRFRKRWCIVFIFTFQKTSNWNCFNSIKLCQLKRFKSECLTIKMKNWCCFITLNLHNSLPADHKRKHSSRMRTARFCGSAGRPYPLDVPSPPNTLLHSSIPYPDTLAPSGFPTPPPEWTLHQGPGRDITYPLPLQKNDTRLWKHSFPATSLTVGKYEFSQTA